MVMPFEMIEQNIFVTGTGIISSIGKNTQACFKSLKGQDSGISGISILDTVHKDDFKAGEIKLTNKELFELLLLPTKEFRMFTRTSLLGAIAAKEALEDSGIDLNDKTFRTAIVSANTIGGMDRTELEINDLNSKPEFLLTHPCGASTNRISEYLGHTGYRTTLSTACSSGANAIIHGINLIKNSIVDRAIVGGVDPLSKFTLNGFNSLMILDHHPCMPFDANRKGLNLGEGAGYIIIESENSILNRGKKALCRITGYANANDAFHQTASSPEGEGAYLAMNAALQKSGLKPSDIDYVNVHGTGTKNNDLSEGSALKRLFGENIPDFSSTKSFTGHTLGASAGIEAVFSVISILHGIVFPNLNFSTPMSELGIAPQIQMKEKEIRNVLSNSFGFGGNNSSLIFSK